MFEVSHGVGRAKHPVTLKGAPFISGRSTKRHALVRPLKHSKRGRVLATKGPKHEHGRHIQRGVLDLVRGQRVNVPSGPGPRRAHRERVSGTCQHCARQILFWIQMLHINRGGFCGCQAHRLRELLGGLVVPVHQHAAA